jgi:hypothetical protein
MMLTVEQADGSALLELRLYEKLSRADYSDVLIPEIEKALESHERLRLLVIIGESFSGFELGAAWEDMKLGLSHWSGFDRIALAADQGWITGSARMLAPLMPCPVQVFPLAGADDARRWLRESLGTVHMAVLDGGALHVQLMGRLDPEVIARVEDRLGDHIRNAEGGFRLLLDLTEFDGWQGLTALSAHFSLVRQHAPLAKRVAVLGDQSWQQAAQRLAGSFNYAETRFFDAAARAEAEAWLTG